MNFSFRPFFLLALLLWLWQPGLGTAQNNTMERASGAQVVYGVLGGPLSDGGFKAVPASGWLTPVSAPAAGAAAETWLPWRGWLWFLFALSLIPLVLVFAFGRSLRKNRALYQQLAQERDALRSELLEYSASKAMPAQEAGPSQAGELHYARMLLRKAPIGVAVLHEGEVRWANAKAEELVGLEGGKTGRSFFVNHDDAMIVDEAMRRQGMIVDFFAQVYGAGDQIKEIHLTGVVAEYEGLAMQLFWMVDISLMKRLEKALTEAHYAAEVATHTQNDFLARMSHEIRTPMNAILGMAYLCLQTKLTIKQKDYLSKIQEAAQMLLGAINDILEFSKADNEGVALDQKPFHLDAFLNSIGIPLSQRAGRKGLDYEVRISPDMPNRLVGDSLRLSQVLQVLIGNAIKFTEKGGVSVRVNAEAEDAGGVNVHFIVSDTGIGMDPEEIRRLFQPFAQADDSSTRRFGGTGLGLAISKSLVELMGGKIWAESEPGKGSVFHFIVRLDKEIRDPVVAPASLDFHDMEILVVDDSPVSVEALTAQAESLGFKVTSAASGVEALNIMDAKARQGGNFRVLLLDWQMDELDGIETAHLLHSAFLPVEVPYIILVSSSDAQLDPDMLKSNGIQARLTKPVTRDDLESTIARLIGKVPARPEEIEAMLMSAPGKTIAGAKVLLVEDNEINQEIAMALLEEMGLHIDLATNGAEAVDRIKNEGAEYQLVFMDIQMPVMDGLEAARKIRAMGHSLADLPIVAMTAHARESDRELSLDVGMNDHITKPLDPILLHDTLMRWIDPARIPSGRTLPAKPRKPYPVDEKASGYKGDYYTIAGRAVPLADGELPGFSQQAGLESVGGNQALYAKLLRKFRESCRTADLDILNAMDARDGELAVRTAHTVKGVSASLGMLALSQIASTTEKSLKEQGLVNFDASLIDSFRHELNKALDAVDEYLGDSSEETAPVAGQVSGADLSGIPAQVAARTMELLQRLNDSLESDWGMVMSSHEQIAELLQGSSAASFLYNLTVAVENFDVPQARLAVQSFTDALLTILPT